jgi:hypothetical protein
MDFGADEEQGRVGAPLLRGIFGWWLLGLCSRPSGELHADFG